MPRPATPLHRTTIDIEIDAFEAARRALGTRGYRDTVNSALREAARIAKLRAAAEAARAGTLGLVEPEELQALRRGRS